MEYDNNLFIEKSKLLHGGKYDYSLVDYKNLRTKVKIICSVHGEFEQTPDKHFMKRGCPCCVGSTKLTLSNFIERSNEKHNFYYDYSLVNYKNAHTEIKILCPEHGEFEQFPQSHIDVGCVLCKREENFIQSSKIVHNDKYDYSLVDYKDKYTKVKIICPTHGEFEQEPVYHIRGNSCKKCSDDVKRLDTDIFIEKAQKIHGNKYDYSLVDYKGAYDKVKIICSIHDEFEQKACDHIYGYGCPKCGGTMKSTTEDFILKAKKVHRNKYDYSLVDYNLCTDKIKIICKKHGEFEQLAHIHLSGCGCPICNQSKGENAIMNFLSDNNIKYIPQKKFDNCKNINVLPFDFYLTDYDLCVEFDGLQHFEPRVIFGGEIEFIKRVNNDKIKTDFCKNNNIKLLRIKYNENIIEKLKNKLNNYVNSLL